jgi:type IV pilus assembly protein PilV
VNTATSRRRAGSSQRGSAIVEVLVSVLLFSIGIIGLLGVLEVSIKDAGEIQFRAAAATLADEMLGRMWVDRANLAGYQVTDAPVAELPNGLRTVAVDGDVVSITISWQSPGMPVVHSHTTSATVAVN